MTPTVPIPEATTSPATQPATRPATFPTQGDIFLQVTEAIEETGIADAITETPVTQWVFAFAAIFLGLVAGKLIAMATRYFGTRAAERGRLFRTVFFNSFPGPATLFCLTIGLAVAMQFVVLNPLLRDFVIRTLQLLNLISIGWLLFNLVDLLTLLLTRWTRSRQGNLTVMLVPLARKTLRVMLVTVLLLFAAENIFNQDVRTLLAGLGIAGLAVSLAAQDSIKNLFGSVTIFTDQPFAIGEFVEVGAHKGTVEDIGFRSTRIRTLDGFLLTIPNSKVADEPIVNQSRRRKIRRVIDLGLTYDMTPDQMETALGVLRQLMSDPEIAAPLATDTDPVRIAFDEMLADQLRIRVFYWYRGGNYWDYLAHAERVNLEILRRLGAAGIDFAFPTQTIVVKRGPRPTSPRESDQP